MSFFDFFLRQKEYGEDGKVYYTRPGSLKRSEDYYVRRIIIGIVPFILAAIYIFVFKH